MALSPMSLMTQWSRFENVPFAKALFGLGVRFAVPYAGTVRPHIELFAPGHARVRMADRRSVRNHLDSVHAAALFNLAEFTANLAMISRQPEHGRWIVRGMDIDYQKKARGPLTAEAHIPELDWDRAGDVSGEVTVRDAQGEVVALARPRWRIGPREAKA